MIQYGIQARGMLPVHTHIAPEQGGQINSDDLYFGCGGRIYRENAQVIGTGAITKILWDAPGYDIGGDFDPDGVDSNFIAPALAYYACYAQVRLGAIADGKLVRMYFYINNVEVTMSQFQSGKADDLTVFCYAKIPVGLAETVDARIWHDHGGDRSILGSTSTDYFEVFKLGE